MKPRARPAHTIAIIGTGLIGASIGLALRRGSKGTRIIGYDKRAASARIARRRGALTSIAPSLEAAVVAAEVTVLAVPLDAVIAMLPRVIRTARKGSLIIDVAGLKVPVLAAAAPLLAKASGVSFVGGHPFAGRERAGPQAAAADLFAGRPFALCVPAQRAQLPAARKAQALVRSLGAHPLRISAADHDRIVAATSALPQVVSSAVALAARSSLERTPGLIGPSFESVTRLAASPPELWVRPLLANRRHTVRMLIAAEGWVRNFRQAIERYNDVRLRRMLRSAANVRRRLKSR